MSIKPIDLFRKLAIEGAHALTDTLISWQLIEMLNLGNIDDDPRVKSLALGEGPWGYGLRISTSFIEEYVSDSNDAVFLLLHELSHRIQEEMWGHLAAGESLTSKLYAANLVEDMIINRYLEQTFFPDGLQILDKIYRPDRWPEVFLASPLTLWKHLYAKSFLKHHESLNIFALTNHFSDIGCSEPRSAGIMYLSSFIFLYNEERWDGYPGTIGDLYNELHGLLRNQGQISPSIMFLGNHTKGLPTPDFILDQELTEKLLPRSLQRKTLKRQPLFIRQERLKPDLDDLNMIDFELSADLLGQRELFSKIHRKPMV